MEWERVGDTCECVLVSIPSLISFVDFVCGLVSASVSEFDFDVPQDLFGFLESVAQVLH